MYIVAVCSGFIPSMVKAILVLILPPTLDETNDRISPGAWLLRIQFSRYYGLGHALSLDSV